MGRTQAHVSYRPTGAADSGRQLAGPGYNPPLQPWQAACLERLQAQASAGICVSQVHAGCWCRQLACPGGLWPICCWCQLPNSQTALQLEPLLCACECPTVSDPEVHGRHYQRDHPHFKHKSADVAVVEEDGAKEFPLSE